MGNIKRSIGLGAAVIVLLAAGIVVLGETGTQVNPNLHNQPALTPMTANLNTGAVTLSAPATILIDAQTGQVLYAKNVLQRHYPASLVKLMTSLIALERVKNGSLTLNSIIPVSQQAYQVALTPGLSVAYLNPTESIPLSKMLEYMYVVSADDAAVALADALAGSEAQFARLMNKQAQAMGLTGTHYVNASGLQNLAEYTNAYDVARLSQYIIQKFPIVLKYASEPGMYIHPGQYGYTYDQLLGQYSGLDGLKTGSTDQAGYCFSGTAIRNGHRLISVVLDANSFSNVFQDTETLLDYGFSQFKRQKLFSKDQALSTLLPIKKARTEQIAVAPNQDVWINLPTGQKNTIQTQLVSVVDSAPIAKGEQVAFEEVGINGHMVMKVPMYAQNADPKAGVITKTWRAVLNSAHQGSAWLIHWVTHKVLKF